MYSGRRAVHGRGLVVRAQVRPSRAVFRAARRWLCLRAGPKPSRRGYMLRLGSCAGHAGLGHFRRCLAVRMQVQSLPNGGLCCKRTSKTSQVLLHARLRGLCCTLRSGPFGQQATFAKCAYTAFWRRIEPCHVGHQSRTHRMAGHSKTRCLSSSRARRLHRWCTRWARGFPMRRPNLLNTTGPLS